MKTTEILMREHRTIEKVLEVLEVISSSLLSNKSIPVEDLQKAITFLKTFADRCHHGKEEDILFPAMEKAGIPREGGPIGVMLTEHEEGRTLISQMSSIIERYALGDANAGKELAIAISRYVRLLRQHIYKEDNILFKMAEAHIDTSLDEHLARKCEQFEEMYMEPDIHEKMHEIINELTNKYKPA